jgi:hypothetical protein
MGIQQNALRHRLPGLAVGRIAQDRGQAFGSNAKCPQKRTPPQLGRIFRRLVAVELDQVQCKAIKRVANLCCICIYKQTDANDPARRSGNHPLGILSSKVPRAFRIEVESKGIGTGGGSYGRIFDTRNPANLDSEHFSWPTPTPLADLFIFSHDRPVGKGVPPVGRCMARSLDGLAGEDRNACRVDLHHYNELLGSDWRPI